MDKTAEIERHKYFLSEKKGYDVGWDFAQDDWESQYGEAWRNQQRLSEADARENGSEACSANAATASVAEIGESNQRTQDEHSNEPPRFRIGSLLSRFFSRN